LTEKEATKRIGTKRPVFKGGKGAALLAQGGGGDPTS